LVPPQGGMRCLGYPLGSQEYCRNFYNERAEETEKYVDKIIELTEYGHEIAIQSSYLLLRYCCEPKIAHLLRAAPPEEIAEACKKHDNAILRGANAIMGPGDCLGLSELRPMAWGNSSTLDGQRDAGWKESIRLARHQLRAPLRKGGMGLVSAEDASPTAFLGGMARVAKFLSSSAGDEIGNRPFTGTEFANALTTGVHQHCISAQRAWNSVEDQIRRGNVPWDEPSKTLPRARTSAES
jgi:hypothetical protein